MSLWFDREAERLEKMLADGDLTLQQFNEEMRELQRSLEAEAQENAERAYRDTLGY